MDEIVNMGMIFEMHLKYVKRIFKARQFSKQAKKP